MDHEVWTPQELSDRWHCKQTTVYAMLKTGKLRGFRVGAMWRILAGDIDAYEHKRTEAQEEDESFDPMRFAAERNGKVVTRIV